MSASAPGCLVPDPLSKKGFFKGIQPPALARGCLDVENDVKNDVESGTEKRKPRRSPLGFNEPPRYPMSTSEAKYLSFMCPLPSVSPGYLGRVLPISG